jgi:hypothetical protein
MIREFCDHDPSKRPTLEQLYRFRLGNVPLFAPHAQDEQAERENA